VSKAYSNKALPAGTIIREWRLEDVLGVGGFGIVYKGRGIYFGELVAIKEYFPSAISERDEEDTVVPIGSDVEEVHALGLKKFVEEAKLLWNLSTPSRHPNIVSVRSLFEVHGTAYMVMDFEDGISLSKLLKEGRKFNERSLWSIIKPIAEGLDRAHRVGVLHRDIKPPNILITEDNRPVLIDFGSARFEAAEATSTTVTFHTPPYAAVEQYVKTYPQGPWTDIYALAVVLYECVTGEKPPEVLERLHGGLGTPLADEHWPGFSRKFLEAIDAGMTIRPTERPQSIQDWLKQFPKKSEPVNGGDDEATRFFAHEVATDEIVPVAALAPGAGKKEVLETGVPKDPKEAEFKQAGQETKAGKRKKTVEPSEAAALAAAAATASEAEPAETADEEKAEAISAEAAKPAKIADRRPVNAADTGQDNEPWYRKPRTLMLAGAAAVLTALAAGGLIFGGGPAGRNDAIDVIPAMTEAEPGPVELAEVVGIAADERTLAEEAKQAGAPAAAVAVLVTAGEQLDKLLVELRPLLDDPNQVDAASARATDMKRTAAAANSAFAGALLRDAEARAQRLTPTASATPAGQRVSEALAALRASTTSAASAANPAESMAAVRDALAKSRAFAAALPAASAAALAERRPVAPVAVPTQRQATATVVPSTAAAPVAAAPAPTSAAASASKVAQLRSVVANGRSRARQVIAMGSGSDVRRNNAKLARNYDSYLAGISDSMRGSRTDREIDQMLKQANQTKAYIDFLYKQSSEGN
jgi:non-specific serine/threonine protein kinase